MSKKKRAAFAAMLTLLLPLAVYAASEFPSFTGNAINSYGGFDYELWSQKANDNVSMVLTGGGTFVCGWKAENVLFRTGKKLGSEKTCAEYGNVSVNYGAVHDIKKGDVSYLCVYGWTQNPLAEFYVVENYGSYKPPGGVGFMGKIEIDGGEYEVYTDTRVNMPSIEGTKTFPQYFSVRADKRTEGEISLSEHFKAWEELGLDMSGKLYEIALCVEGYKSEGFANIYNHVLTVGGAVYGQPFEQQADAALQAAELFAEPGAGDVPIVDPAARETSAPETGESNFIYIAIGVFLVMTAATVILSLKARKK